MTAISSLSDEEVDELLAGHAPDDGRELAPVAEVATALRRHTAEEPAPVMRYPLRHAMARTVAPVAARSRRALHAALSGAAIAMFGLAGAANALPAPLQDAVAEVGGFVGVEVPHASDDDQIEPAPYLEQPSVMVTEPDNASTEPWVHPPPTTTSGGAVPADPETPVDLEPATPAVPPEPQTTADGRGVVPDPNADDDADDNGDGDDADDGDDANGADDTEAGNGNATDTSDPDEPKGAPTDTRTESSYDRATLGSAGPVA